MQKQKNTTITFRVTETERKNIKEEAEKFNLTISDYVRLRVFDPNAMDRKEFGHIFKKYFIEVPKNEKKR